MGRLWQLERTLTTNLYAISQAENVDLVLLDYHSPDGLREYILDNFQAQLDSGILKYYSLVTEKEYLDLSYAKNVALLAASGELLFSLDADNYVGSTIPEMRKLEPNTLLVTKFNREGRYGRLGIHASDFHRMRGFDESLDGVNIDDVEFRRHAEQNKLIEVWSLDTSMPVQNTPEQKQIYTNPNGKRPSLVTKKFRNVGGFGNATIMDHLGNTFNIGME